MLREKNFFLTPFNEKYLDVSREFVTFDVGARRRQGSQK